MNTSQVESESIGKIISLTNGIGNGINHKSQIKIKNDLHRAIDQDSKKRR